MGTNNNETFTISTLATTAINGNDKVYAGAGDDTVIFNSFNAGVMNVDGGSGINFLQLAATATATTLDLTDAAVRARVHNFNSIDMTGAGANTLKLNWAAVVDLSNTTDVAGNLAYESKMVVVSGNAGDTLNLVNLTSWNVGAVQTAEALSTVYGSAYNFLTGHTYKAYTLNGATVFVDQAMTVATLAASTTSTVTYSQVVTIDSLVAASFTDANGAGTAFGTFKGVAITAAGIASDLTTYGKYQLSKDGGTTWTDVAAGLTDTTAVYADKTALIRYVGVTGLEVINPQNLSVRLIDNSGLTGTGSLTTTSTGITVDAHVNGANTAFSGGNASGVGDTVTLNLLNRAPVSSSVNGVVYDDLLSAATLTDVSAGVLTGNGSFAFGTGTVTVSGNTNTVLFPAASQFVPGTYLWIGDGTPNTNETVLLTFSSPVLGVTIDFQALNANGDNEFIYINGIQYALKESDFSNMFFQTAANIATTPVINADGSFTGRISTTGQGNTSYGRLTILAVNVPGGVINSLSLQDKSPNGNGVAIQMSLVTKVYTTGQSVEALFGSTYTDADFDTLRGVVITSAGTAADLTSKGQYQYSTNGGTTWVNLAAGLTDTTSVFLAKTDLIRFVKSSTNSSPAAKSDLVARLVDDSATTAPLSGAIVDVSNAKNGGSTPYSATTVTLRPPTAPVGANDVASATENGGANNATLGANPANNVLANDSDVDSAHSTLVVQDILMGTNGFATAVSAGTNSSNGQAIVGSYGTLVMGADGTYTYTVDQANATVQALNTGSTALNEVFTYTVKDPTGLTSTATLSVAVNGANDAPVVATVIADTIGFEGKALNYVVPAGSFTDVDNATLSYTATFADGSALSTKGLSFNVLTRTLSGTPSVGTGGSTLSIKVTASDGSLSVTDTFDIVVGMPYTNHAPVLADTALSFANMAQTAVVNNPIGVVGKSVSDFMGGVSDQDSIDGKGMAITSIDTTNGKLWYSTDNGTTWQNVDISTPVSESHAFLLAANTNNRLYFQPNVDYAGVSNALTFRAWDQTEGSSSASFTNITAYGDPSAFSNSTDIVSQAVPLSYIPTNASSIYGGKAFETAGYAVSTVGDVNGDGYDDFMICAPYNTNQLQLTGASAGAEIAVGTPVIQRNYVVFGRSDNLMPMNLSSLTSANNGLGFVINATSYGYAQSVSNNFGDVSSAGDVNGDGLNDMMASYIHQEGTAFIANTYVVYGTTSSNPINVSSLAATQGYSVTGTAIGSDVSNVGDLNGDGLSDLVVTNQAATSAYVLLGQTSTSTTLAAGAITLSYTGAPSGGATNSYTKASGVGDVNGDGLADLLVSVANTTASYVVFGKTNFGSVTLNTQTAGFTITNTANSILNVSAVGDVNGDGLADVLVEDPNVLVSGSTVGRSYVVFGKTTTTVVNLSTLTAGTSTLGFVINGGGYSVASAGDFNGDGLADMIIGGGGYEAYVLFGKTSTAVVELSNIANGVGGIKIFNNAGNFSKSISYGGDLNGDGYADLIVGAPTANATNPLPTYAGTLNTFRTNEGKVYIIYGGSQYISGAVATGTGTSANEYVAGTVGTDTLVGGGGVDTFSAGKGDDIIVLQASDVANLANNSVSSSKSWVDGGEGFDTLQLTGGANLDLKTISNVGAMLDISTSRINSIERIDMSTDATANILTIAAKDVNDMAGFNSIHIGTVSDDGKTWTNVTGTALSTTTQFHQVVVDGTVSDIVNLQGSAGAWTKAGTVNDGSNNYDVWQNMTAHSQVIVAAAVVVNANVAPVVLDLNHDGLISYSQVQMDVNGDGHLDQTVWVAAQDGVLVWDKYADGKVHDNSQYAFSQYGAADSTDLEGLAAGFDSNQNGLLDASDAKFGEFKVWQDANQNGVTDAGELRSLAAAGIISITLASDGVVRHPDAGVTEAGHSTATLADGSSVLVADAAFSYSSLAYLMEGSSLNVSGAAINLDLSSVLAVHNNVTTIDLTGLGANSLTLTLNDVLNTAVTNGLHQLTLTGDATDSVQLTADEWTNTGTTVIEGDHSYAVYNATTSSEAQLLIDQAMVNAGHVM